MHPQNVYPLFKHILCPGKYVTIYELIFKLKLKVSISIVHI